MNPEKRLIGHGIEVAVELLVVFILQFAGLLCPKRGGVVDDIVFVGVHLLAVFPFLFLAEGYGNGEEAAILLQEGRNAGFFQEFLAILVNVEDDIRATVGAVGIFQGEFGTSVTRPLDGLGVFTIGLGDNLHLFGHHESRVEAQAKMSDNGIGIILIFLQEVVSAGEGYLVDIFVDFIGCQSQAAVGYGQGILAQGDVDGEVAQVALEVAHRGKGLQLLCGVHGIGHQFAEEDFVVAIQEFLDDGEYILCGYPNISFLHNYVVLIKFPFFHTQKKCQPQQADTLSC